MTAPEPRPGTSPPGLAARLGLAGPSWPQRGGAHRGSRSSPPTINLTTARDRQSIVVQATYADGITRDVTAEATHRPRPTRRWSAATGATFYPVADGETTLAVAFGGQTVDASRSRSRRRRSTRR